MRIQRMQHPSPQPLKVGMRHDEPDQLPGEAAPAIFPDNEDIREISHPGMIGHDPRIPYLPLPMINPEIQRMILRGDHLLKWYPRGPIRFF